jgi:hypothetical protein
MSSLLVFSRVYRLEIQSVMLVFSTPLTSHWFTSPPLCEQGGTGDRIVWRASTGIMHCVFDQIPNLQNCISTPKKNLGGEGASDRETSAAKSLSRKIFKKSRHLGLESVNYLVHARNYKSVLVPIIYLEYYFSLPCRLC